MRRARIFDRGWNVQSLVQVGLISLQICASFRDVRRSARELATVPTKDVAQRSVLAPSAKFLPRLYVYQALAANSHVFVKQMRIQLSDRLRENSLRFDRKPHELVEISGLA